MQNKHFFFSFLGQNLKFWPKISFAGSPNGHDNDYDDGGDEHDDSVLNQTPVAWKCRRWEEIIRIPPCVTEPLS